VVDKIDERIKHHDDEALTLQFLSKKLGYSIPQGNFRYAIGGLHTTAKACVCSLCADPKEELVAAWILLFAKEGWWSSALYNMQNII